MGTIRPRDRLALAAIGALGLLAIAQHWFDERRPPAPENRATRELFVTTGADRGEGSLREAIFNADSADGRVRIVLRTPRIQLRSALPPLVNPKGISIEAGGGGCEIDLAAVAPGPAIEVRGERSQIVGVSLANAPGQALRVAAKDFRLASGRIAASGEGVRVIDGADGLVIENMRFDGNGTGVRVDTPRPGMVIRDNAFGGHLEAGIWVVRPADAAVASAETLAITGNRFDRDRLSIVAGNAPVAIERNEFIGHREAAVLMLGSGIQVRANQVRDGEGIGILAQGAPRATIEGNDVSRNRALGVLVRYSGGTTVQNNRVYSNGYGMAFVLGEAGNPVVVDQNAVMSQRYDGIVVIGDSPVIRRNRTVNNGQAGVRLLDLQLRDTPRVVSTPFLESNTMAGNLLNEIIRGEYRVDGEKASR